MYYGDVKPTLKHLAIPKIIHAEDDSLLSLMVELISRYQSYIASNDPKVRDVYMTTKGGYINSKDNFSGRKEYGYWPCRYIKELLDIIKYFKIDSFCDLGSGMGMLSCIIGSVAKIPVKGIEKEDVLLKIAERTRSQLYNVGVHYRKGDLLKLKREDIEQYRALYFWEPISDTNLCLKFITRLVDIMDDKQIIICYPAASSRQHLLENKKTEYLAQYGPYHLFQLKREHK
jgi:hypothetical protein